jgi:arabinan endo-1,5-alpha-L-arabinosidase
MENLEIVLDIDFPDPSVMRASDGKYYAYATQRFAPEKIYNIQVARSDDLKNWKFIGDALPNKPEWASTTQDFWAPHVVEDGGRFYMYYSALPNDRQGMGIGVAISDNPLGPFIDKGAPLVYGHGFVNIDPFAFDDPQTGQKLLYWGSGFEAIRVRELANSRLEFKEGTEQIEILHPTPTYPHENLIEGAFIRYKPEEDYYFLFTSGDDFSNSYAVLISRSKSALGPYQKLAELVDREDNILIKGNDYLEHPGNNSIVTDESGQDWFFCHCIDPKLRHDRATGALRRPMARAKIHYQDGWPHIEGWSTHHLNRSKG